MRVSNYSLNFKEDEIVGLINLTYLQNLANFQVLVLQDANVAILAFFHDHFSYVLIYLSKDGSLIKN